MSFYTFSFYRQTEMMNLCYVSEKVSSKKIFHFGYRKNEKYHLYWTDEDNQICHIEEPTGNTEKILWVSKRDQQWNDQIRHVD